MQLSEDRVDQIWQDIDRSGLTLQSLKEDLLDHLCCYVEVEMKAGLSFEEAYSSALQQVCPNGFEELEAETIFLLNYKRIVLMKKLMYAIGLITSISISVGWLFKILHYPGGQELFVYGFLGFVLIFLPMLAIDRYKTHINKVLSERLKIILGFVSAFITGLSVLFKLMHFQGANELLLIGVLIFSFGFLPFLFFRMYKKSVD